VNFIKRGRILCIVLASAMALSATGCGSGEKIKDFYLQTNKEWTKEHALADDKTVYSYADEKEEILRNRVMTILEENDSKDASFAKVSDFYRQLSDADQRENLGNAAIRKYMDRVEAVQSLEEMYELMKDPEMSLLNPFMKVDYLMSTDGRYRVHFDVMSVYGFHDKTP